MLAENFMSSHQYKSPVNEYVFSDRDKLGHALMVLNNTELKPKTITKRKEMKSAE